MFCFTTCRGVSVFNGRGLARFGPLTCFISGSVFNSTGKGRFTVL